METPVDFVEASYQRVFFNGKITKCLLKDEIIEQAEHAVAKAFYEKKKKNAIVMWNKLYDIRFLKIHDIRCVSHLTIEDNLFCFQLVLKANSCQFLSNITYICYERINSNTYKIKKSITPKYGKEYAEIIAGEKEYIHSYLQYDFYPLIVKDMFPLRLSYASQIYYSHVPTEEKRTYISTILKHQMSFNEARCVNKISCWLIFLISLMPSILQILLYKSYKIIQKMIYS
jgi:hypothetical protein